MDGIRFPDDMTEHSSLNVNDKFLVSVFADGKKAKWYSLQRLYDWVSNLFVKKDASNLGPSLSNWQETLEIALLTGKINNGAGLNAYALTKNGDYLTSDTTTNLPDTSKIGILSANVSEAIKFLRYRTIVAGSMQVWDVCYGTTWGEWKLGDALPNHSDLPSNSLIWTNSQHIGTPGKYAAFGTSGEPVEVDGGGITSIFVDGETITGNGSEGNPLVANIPSLGTSIHAATAGTSMLDEDEIGFWKNVGGVLRKITFANLKALFLTDAPSDGKTYARKDGEWEDITKIIPLTGQTFNGQFDLTSRYSISFNQYACNTTLTPTIAANPIVQAFNRVVIDAGASASLVATNMGTKRVGSDNFTSSKLNEIVITQEEEGLYYQIRILN